MLSGRVVIVSGGGRGLGRAHCLELADQHATVVVNDPGVGVRGDGGGGSPAKDVVAEISARGGAAVADETSVTDFDAVGDLVRWTVDTFGRLDAVVNNAGIIRDGMLTKMTEDDFDQVVAVHLKGTFCLTRHACEHWRSLHKSGSPVSGRIVNTTSGTGLFGNVGQANYGAAKAAVANLTVVTAMEMQRYGVTANAISPIARTRMTEGLTLDLPADEGFDPLDPANASPVVAWLASEQSGWLSGAILRIEGDSLQRVRGWEVDRSSTLRTAPGQRLQVEALDQGMRRLFGILPTGVPTTGS